MSGFRNMHLLPRYPGAGRRPVAAWGCLALILAAACGEQAEVGRSAPDGVHAEGWKKTHGSSLRSVDPADVLGTIEGCETCHAQGQEPTCESCHTPDADGCRTCHESLPDTHAAHGATPDRIGEETEAACGYCHQVPSQWRDADHLSDRGPGDIVFSGRATARDHAPTYADGKCTNTACHNGPGARVPEPAWGTEFAHPVCGSCHGLPPPAPHPNSTKCQNCHGEVAPASIRNLESPHPNGKVVVDDLDAKECTDCHGNPPESGAHLAHLSAENAHPVECATCHRVPEKVTDPGHIDDGTPGVEITFGEAAGAEATFARGKCSNVTCHGQDTPAWNGEAPCGSCHGVPPRDHPAGECSRCHPGALVDGTPRDPITHMDGVVDNRALAADACDTCHGEGAPVAPPPPHAKHLRFGCETCHPKPETPQAEGHLNGRVETVPPLGLPARGGDGERVQGAREGEACAVPTCHGEGRPLWVERPEPLACDACHANPPAGHAQMPCENCHRGNTHANGTVDTNFGDDCADCHGNPPPTGAHLAHTQPRFSRPVPCATCHQTPTLENINAEGHFGPPPAEVDLQNGQYDPVQMQCTNVTCHNALGATGVPLSWDAVDSGAASCGACHGVPPPGHGPVDCVHCHAPTAGPGMTIRQPENHVNGTLDRSGAAVLPPAP